MKLFRNLFIGTLAAMGIVACITVTLVAAKVYRHLSLNDRNENRCADWENLGVTHEFDFPHYAAETPGIARVAHFGDADDDQDAEACSAVVEEELCGASPEEWEIWKTELKGRSPEAVREILSFRRTRREAAPEFIRRRGECELTAADVPSAEPQRLAEASAPSAPRTSGEVLGTIDAAIEAIDAAEQAILNNMTNELSELRRMQEQLKTLRQLRAELSSPSPTP
jgi:hypothetical protein